MLRFKYTTKFSLPKIACPAIVYAEIVVVIDPFFVGVCLLIKVYRYNPTDICQQRLQGVRNLAHKLCSWERSFRGSIRDLIIDHATSTVTSTGVGHRLWREVFFPGVAAMLFMQYAKGADSQVNETQLEECIHTAKCGDECTTEKNLTEGDSRLTGITTSRLAEDPPVYISTPIVNKLELQSAKLKIQPVFEIIKKLERMETD